jgi:hypothetical protein
MKENIFQVFLSSLSLDVYGEKMYRKQTDIQLKVYPVLECSVTGNIFGFTAA